MAAHLSRISICLRSHACADGFEKWSLMLEQLCGSISVLVLVMGGIFLWDFFLFGEKYQ